MANTLILGSGGIQTVAAGATRYGTISSASNVNEITESWSQVTWRTAGTFSKLYWHIPSGLNTLSGSVTLRVRIDGADGNQSIAVSAAGTGDFYDDSSTDTITATQKVNYSIVAAAGTGSVGWRGIGMVFAASSNTVCRYASRGETSPSSNTTYYRPLCSEVTGSANTTEAKVQAKVGTAGTFKTLYAFTDTNTYTAGNASTIRSRKNGADGNLVITYDGGVTGALEDTSNSDTIAVANYINYSITTPNAAGLLKVRNVSAAFESTNGKFPICWSAIDGTSVGAPDKWNGIAGGYQGEATEANYQLVARMAGTASYAVVYTTGARNQATTMILKKNGAATAVQIPCTASISGEFSNTTDSVSFVATDTLYWEANTGGGSGNFIYNHLTLTIDGSVAVSGKIAAVDAQTTHTEIKAQVAAVDAETTHTEIKAQVAAVDAETTHTEIKAQLAAVDAETTHTEIKGQVVAVDAETTHTEIKGQIAAVDAEITYNIPGVQVTAVDAETTHTEVKGQIAAVDAETTHTEIKGQIAAVDADITYSVTGALSAQIAAVDAETTHTEVKGQIAAVDAETTHTEIKAQVAAVDAETTHTEIKAQVAAVDADITYSERKALVTALDADATFTEAQSRISAVDAEITHDVIKVSVSAVDAAITYSTGQETGRITAASINIVYEPELGPGFDWGAVRGWRDEESAPDFPNGVILQRKGYRPVEREPRPRVPHK